MTNDLIRQTIAKVSNWGRWGRDDELGTVNFIDAAKRRQAATLVESGRVFSLAVPLDEAGPQPDFERRLNPRHIMLETGTDLLAHVQRGQVDGWGFADDMVVMALQCGTQWDSLAHAFHDYKMYNDRDCALVSATGAEKNAIRVLADKIVTRAVLVDLPRYLGVDWLEPTHRVTVEEMEGALRAEHTDIGRGDVMLLRTGNLARAQASGSWAKYTYSDEPGIGVETLPWFYEREVAAIAADTWAVEALPSQTPLRFAVHAVAIVYMGLLLGEIFALDALASDCAADGRYDCLLVAPPLPFSKAVGSPVNPIAVK